MLNKVPPRSKNPNRSTRVFGNSQSPREARELLAHRFLENGHSETDEGQLLQANHATVVLPASANPLARHFSIEMAVLPSCFRKISAHCTDHTAPLRNAITEWNSESETPCRVV